MLRAFLISAALCVASCAFAQDQLGPEGPARDGFTPYAEGQCDDLAGLQALVDKDPEHLKFATKAADKGGQIFIDAYNKFLHKNYAASAFAAIRLMGTGKVIIGLIHPDGAQTCAASTITESQFEEFLKGALAAEPIA